jgi:hypothetical protein
VPALQDEGCLSWRAGLSINSNERYLKGWLSINVWKTILNENSIRKSIGQQVGVFSAV